MSIIFKVLSIFIGLIVILLVVALFVKKRYTIIRETTISSPVADVYDYLRFHKNQKQYNHWLQLDPNVRTEIKGAPDGQPGSILFFESKSKKAGTGEWENTDFVENERIDIELRFLQPYQFTADAKLHFKPIDEETTLLVWEYHSGMNWPLNITLLFIDMDKIIGRDIENTLENIKRQLEK